MLRLSKKSKPKRGLVAVLDVGSSTITCAIADLSPEGPVEIIGYGQTASSGIHCGVIVDMEEAESAVVNAVHQAEKMAGVTIKEIYVGVNGPYLVSACYRGRVSISDHAVDDGDVRSVFQKACEAVLKTSQFKPIHMLPLAYTIDQVKGIRDPRGMFGDELQLLLHVIAGKSGPLQNMMTCIGRCHLEIAGFIAIPYAAGLSSLVEDEKELGVTLIEMGGASTSFSVFHKGQIVYMGCVPMGGQHVTSDIARGLSTPLSHAERLKNMYGTALVSSAEAREVMMVPQMGESRSEGVNQMSRMALVSIIKPRLEETFEHVRLKLQGAKMDFCAGKRVVLSGGASQIAGLRELAAFVLDKHVRLARPLNLAQDERAQDPAFAACAGMFSFIQQDAFEAPVLSQPRRRKPALQVVKGALKGLW